MSESSDPALPPPPAVTRRDFVGTSAAIAVGAVAPMIVPRHVLGGPGYQAPSDTLNVACVGIGGMGMSNMQQLVTGGENVVAVCDVDFPFVERGLWGRTHPRGGTVSPENAKLQASYDRATKFADFREMLDRQKNIDAVVVATPDHAHAIIAKSAMQLGKHVYVQKPLTYSVHEARVLAKLANEQKVATQMGNQGHSQDGTRRIREIIQSGILGPISEVHVWTDRPVRYWAQGIPRPGTTYPPPAPPPANAPPAPPPYPGPAAPPRWNVRTVDNAVIAAMAANPQTPPLGLHWDLWLGPAPETPYHPAYHPFSWRGWVDFGVSAIGDMGAHLIDQPFWALDLSYPTSVTASSTMWGGSAERPASYPLAMTAEYEFAARGRSMPALKLFWYDSGLLPPRPPFLPDDVRLVGGDGGGGVFIGTKGILTYETYGNNPKIYPDSMAQQAAEKVKLSVPRIAESHEMNWAKACKGEGSASSPFEYAAMLTETMLLGVAALRAGQGKKLLYDGAEMRFTNAPDANQYLSRPYRNGWVV